MDIEYSIIGLLVAAWGFGFFCGLIHLTYKKIFDSL